METDVNTDEIQDPVETESSPAKDYEPIEEDGFVSTTEFREVEPDDADDGGDTPEKQDKPASEDKDSKGPVPYDRFQEVINQRNEDRKAREALEQRLAKLEQGKKEPPKQKAQSKYKFKNIMAMEDEEIVDQFTNNPKQFLANYAQQVAHELTADIQKDQAAKMQRFRQQTTHQKMLGNFQKFFEDKEDGIKMLTDGTIRGFMEQNPGHNPISAYYALTGDQHFESRVQEAVKKEREKILKELKAAGRAAPVKSGTSARTYTEPNPTPAKNKADLKQAMLKRLLSNQ